MSRRVAEVHELVRVEQIMGLPVSVRVRHHPGGVDEQHRLELLVDNVLGYLRRVDEVFSTWRPDSELMRVRRGDFAQREAHPWIAEVAALSAEAVRITGGLFCDRLTGPDGSFGWDPTGIVKGWAVERAVNHLRCAPGLAFAVGAGGDIVCGTGRGVDRRSPLATPWQIGIQDPDRADQLLGTLPVRWGAVATSGTAARGAHILDPRTGLPTTRRGSVTVTGPDLTWADVWATACFLDATALERSPRSREQGYRLCLDHTSTEVP